MKYSRPEDIPDSFLNEIKKKKTYRRVAEGRARKLGVSLEELPDDEWRLIWWKRAERRKKYHARKQLTELAQEPVPDGEIDDEVAKYLEYYTDPAPNDLVSIRQLVSFEKQLKRVEELIKKILSSDDPDTAAYKRLADVQKQLSGEVRLLQDSLGISRKQRDAKRETYDLAEHLKQNIDQARELLSDIGTKIYCPHCEGRGTRILLGFVIDHFPETGLTIKKRCPACGEDFEIAVPPRRWVRQVELERSQLVE